MSGYSHYWVFHSELMTADEVPAISIEEELVSELVGAEHLRVAVEALQRIYDRYHMDGDGGAGLISGDALRALGIDPDGQNDGQNEAENGAL